MRDKLGIAEGDELEVFTGEDSGKLFVAFSKISEKADKAKEAKKILEELGIEIPEELEKMTK